MDKKKKNLLEMRKLGFSQKTLSLMTESQVAMILEKIKRKETKEATQNIEKTTTLNKTDVFNNVTVDQMKKLTDANAEKGLVKTEKNVPVDTKIVKSPSELSDEITEVKKKKKKYNPWAVCTASVGRKNKKKFEDCVMGVKKKLKEGRNPYEYLIESKMEEIVENNLSPKMTKGEIMSIIAEKKMMMEKPIGKSTVIGGEMGEDTKTAPTKTPSRTTEKEPARRTPHPGRKTGPNPKPKASDSEMESKKSEIITKISNLIDKLSK